MSTIPNGTTAGRPDPRDAAKVRQSLGETAVALETPYRQAYCTFGAEAANKREITIQVRDRRKAEIHNRFEVTVYLSTAKRGAPNGSVTLDAPTTGILLADYSSGGDNVRKYLTDDQGRVVVKAGYSGAVTLYVHASVYGEFNVSSALVFV